MANVGIVLAGSAARLLDNQFGCLQAQEAYPFRGWER